MSITTRTGDDGTTFCASLGARVDKDHPGIEFIGTLDKAISAIGLARALLPGDAREEDADLEIIQRILFVLGASLSRGEAAPEKAVKVLEAMVEKYYREPLRHFILPAGGPAASATHLARTLVREAERRLVTLRKSSQIKVDPSLIRVLNRASDALFAMAVHLARKYGGGLERVDLNWDFLEQG
ncbi:MAG: cob(I)yrinic acid a,c-diamide adenosyltransferase [Desulfurococcales archaeon]|nr:cob(I)yrinic acid a,c-diamide adenosyltransferase [Desulfurococcales archaeon]